MVILKLFYFKRLILNSGENLVDTSIIDELHVIHYLLLHIISQD